MGLFDDVGNFITAPYRFAKGLVDDYTGKSMNERNIEFQERENKITRKREDNAVQRRAKDMEAAGLNKVLAAGDPASAQASEAPQQGINPAAQGIQGALGMAQIAKTRAEEKALDAKAGVDTAEKHMKKFDLSIKEDLRQTTIDQQIANLGHTEAVTALEKLKAQNEKINIDRNKLQKYHDKIMNSQALEDLDKTKKEIVYQKILNRIGLLNESIRTIDKEFSQATGYSEHIDMDWQERAIRTAVNYLNKYTPDPENMSEEDYKKAKEKQKQFQDRTWGP